ncbi:MAG: hypothetical protein LUE63_05755 [Lachnospiraceae bacterium]|nr:hypothetical protein [Lachnospiraceae bacterium]
MAETKEKKNVRPTVLQMRMLEELENTDARKGLQTRIAERCGCNQSQVSRFLGDCVRDGYLQKHGYGFTEIGRAWDDSWHDLLRRTEAYLRGNGTPENRLTESTRVLFDTMDVGVLQLLLGGYEEKQLANHLQRETWSRPGAESELLAEGERKVGFRFYRLGVDDRRESHYSMANAGFEKPGILRPGKENVLLLTIREMNAASASNGRAMQGHLETLKYPYNGTMQLADICDGRVRLPLDAFRIRRGPGSDYAATLAVTVTCSVGERHMPESTAMLVVWM